MKTILPIRMNRESSSSSSISLNSNHEEDRDLSTIIEEAQFWHEDPIEDNLDPNFGRGQDGARHWRNSSS